MAQGIAARLFGEDRGVSSHGNRKRKMADVFVEWAGRPSSDGRTQAEIESTGCFDLHGIELQESFVAAEERRVLCHFRAPDAESVRLALRQGDIPVECIWTGIIFEGGMPAAANVVIEYTLAPPLPAEPRDALEVARSQWLQPLGLSLQSAVFDLGRSRMILFCEAPPGYFPRLDETGRVPPDLIWSCRRVAFGTAIN
jgi:hypothetical protein